MSRVTVGVALQKISYCSGCRYMAEILSKRRKTLSNQSILLLSYHECRLLVRILSPSLGSGSFNTFPNAFSINCHYSAYFIIDCKELKMCKLRHDKDLNLHRMLLKPESFATYYRPTCDDLSQRMTQF